MESDNTGSLDQPELVISQGFELPWILVLSATPQKGERGISWSLLNRIFPL